MTSGRRRDTLITLQRSTTAPDVYGEGDETWTDLGEEWAAVFYGRGDERRSADQLQGEQAATFNVSSNAMTRALIVRDRIILGADNWNIVSVAPMGRDEVDLTAKRAI